MTTERSAHSPDRLQAVSDAFDQWRRSRHKRCPIPEDLWQAAIALSPQYSTCRIARALRLDYGKLKVRIAETTSRARDSEFVELKSASLFAGSRCAIELRSPGGFHMEIRSEASLPMQFLPLVTAFLIQSR
jgi:hypothetical protein